MVCSSILITGKRLATD
ncbi:MAG: hypothetical protein GWO20_15405, partial [Candidatus Korarchaeota archaeon]|nr:hypothetical protein [Candidatus Korarchaeota archaeon]